MTFNLTPKRLSALRAIQQRPGMDAQALTDHVCEKKAVSWSSQPWNGFMKSANGNQCATRWGARYAQHLIDQDLVRVQWAKNVSWGKLYLTEKGRRVAVSGKLEDEEDG